MDIGAVIVAAGLSSRMGQFKPLMKIGPLSVAQHVINTFHQTGITKIAVVVGHNAQVLKQHLDGMNIVFLQNESYRTSEMFDSAKIGLSYWVDTCERVLFTPIDIPLFSPCTVAKLISTDAQVACPLCNGRRGHPLMLSASAIRSVLKDSGKDGLRGAISRLDTPVVHVEVEDIGTLHDADTPEEFSALLEYYVALEQRNKLYPTDQEIEQIFSEMDTPDPVRAHCEAVTAKAFHLADQISVPVDRALLRAACRLHDIARAKGSDHAALAADYLTKIGYPVLARIVAQHHNLTADARAEAELLYLADKLVQGTDDVTLRERFSAARKKCTSPKAIEMWERRYRDALQIAEHYHLDVDAVS